MIKDEYIEKLKKYYKAHKLEEADSYGEGYTDGLTEAFDYAIDLAEELDEPKKVVIPQFVADWIENDLDYVGKEPVNIVRGVVEDGDCGPRGEWLDSIDNQKLLLNAIANGYEVEKEPKYRVPLPNLNSDNGKQFITYKNSKWFACAHRNNLQQEFTEVELANLPEPYCDYERVEVKDNDQE